MQADILVSELLGSFGDNELSPECLDGAQSFLERKHCIIMRVAFHLSPNERLAGDGVSIPCSYTSHLSPVSSAKLHALVSSAVDKEKVCTDNNCIRQTIIHSLPLSLSLTCTHNLSSTGLSSPPV